MEKVYFGIEIKEKFFLPETNKEQWIEVRKLNASQKALYLNSLGELSHTNPDGTISLDTAKAGNWEFKLLELAVAGYKVMVIEEGVPKLIEGIDPHKWAELYQMMDASITDGLLEVIRNLNPWLKPVTDGSKKK